MITFNHASIFGGLVDITEEPTNLKLNDTSIIIQSLEFKHDSTADLVLQASCPLLEELEIDLQLLNQPASRSAVNTSTTATKHRYESMLPVYNVGGTSSIKDSSVEVNPIKAMPPVIK